jgi:NAD(P)-dependent dehydrogenase (short-subunit alcohol dehydrogenase family)
MLQAKMNLTSIKDAVALVTGGSRGLGKALLEEICARGAGKVYAKARDPRASMSVVC